MTSSEFPSNSRSPQPPQEEEPRKVEAVVTGEVKLRKKSFGKRLKDIFIGGDSRSVLQYVVMDVLVPQAKDMITEAASSGFERLIYGESRPPGRRFGGRSASTPTNYTNYSRYTARGNNPIGQSERRMERPPTAQPRTQELDDLLFATRVEAETVLDRLYLLLEKYEVATVSDLYQSVGWTANYIDQKWGWTNLAGADIRRVRDGYVLNLPRPISLD